MLDRIVLNIKLAIILAALLQRPPIVRALTNHHHLELLGPEETARQGRIVRHQLEAALEGMELVMIIF